MPLAHCVGTCAFRAEHGENGRSGCQQHETASPGQSARFSVPCRSGQRQNSGQRADRPEEGRGKAKADVICRTVQNIQHVAERSCQQDQHETDPQSCSPEQQNEEWRAEQHVAEQVFAVRVQGKRRHAAIPFVFVENLKDVHGPPFQPIRGRQRRQSRHSSGKAPSHADAVPENKQQKKKQRPVRVGVRRNGNGGDIFPRFGGYCRQFGTGQPLKQRGNIDPKSATAACAVGNAARGQNHQPLFDQRNGRRRSAFLSIVDLPPGSRNASGTRQEEKGTASTARRIPSGRGTTGAGRRTPDAGGAGTVHSSTVRCATGFAKRTQKNAPDANAGGIWRNGRSAKGT